MDRILEFLRSAEKLKCEKRDLLLSNGEWESVAAHTWMMSLCAVLFHDKMKAAVDLLRALKIIMVHDLSEAITGDVSLVDQQVYGKADKDEKEKAAIVKILEPLDPAKRDEILSLWQEYQDAATPEARFVKALDKLEATAQVSFSKNLKYMGDFSDGDFYYDDVLNSRRRAFWDHESAFVEFYGLVREEFKSRMKEEGIDAEKYIEKENK